MTFPYADVVFEGGGFAYGVNEVQIHTAEYEHDRAVVLVEGEQSSSKRFTSGAPIRVDWGFVPKAHRSFIGYVNHIEPLAHPTKDIRSPKLLKVVCVAPTWAFKEGGYRTFRGMSATAVIKRLGEEARFDVRHVRQHDRVFPVLHQGGKSLWEFMVELAKKIGWTLFTQGMELHCVDRAQAITQAQTSATVYRPISEGGHIRRFKNSLGATSLTGGDLRVRDAFSVNPRTGRMLARRNEGGTERPLFRAAAVAPVFGQAVIDSPFESLEEAESLLGARERLNQLPVEATLEGALNARVRVGRSVYVEGLDAVDCGHWYVRSAVHRIRPVHESSTDLRLGRDTESPFTGVVPTGLAPPAPRASRLVNRQWVLG